MDSRTQTSITVDGGGPPSPFTAGCDLRVRRQGFPRCARRCAPLTPVPQRTGQQLRGRVAQLRAGSGFELEGSTLELSRECGPLHRDDEGVRGAVRVIGRTQHGVSTPGARPASPRRVAGSRWRPWILRRGVPAPRGRLRRSLRACASAGPTRGRPCRAVGVQGPQHFPATPHEGDDVHPLPVEVREPHTALARLAPSGHRIGLQPSSACAVITCR